VTSDDFDECLRRLVKEKERSSSSSLSLSLSLQGTAPGAHQNHQKGGAPCGSICLVAELRAEPIQDEVS
jgi:hypothetical protein